MEQSKRNYPVQGQVYTLAEILNLTLRDAPFLRFYHNDKLVVVQTLGSDVGTVCQDNPKLLESKWKYIRETHEWIPLFNYAGEEPVTDYVQISPTRHIGMEAELMPYYVRFVGDNTPELTPYQERELEAEKLAIAEQARLAASLAEIRAAFPSNQKKEEQVVVAEPETVKPVVRFPLQDMLQDPAKAQAYVESRSSDAQKFLSSLVWDCSAENDLDKAKFFFAGMVLRYKPNHTLRSVYWGVIELFDKLGEKQAPVYFKTEECFVAWTLAKFG
jgi:hypothetical protein